MLDAWLPTIQRNDSNLKVEVMYSSEWNVGNHLPDYTMSRPENHNTNFHRYENVKS